MAPTVPFLSVNKTGFLFAKIEGAAAPADQGVTLSNFSPSTMLEWTASVQNVSGGSWLSLSSSGGTLAFASLSTIFVHADPMGLAARAYRARVVVDAGAGTANRFQTLGATLLVGQAAPELAVTTSITASAYVGDTADSPGLPVIGLA